MHLNQISMIFKSDKITGRRKSRRVSGNRDHNMMDFVKCLELSDDEILNKYELTLGGTQLTNEQARHFIAFVRQETSRGQIQHE